MFVCGVCVCVYGCVSMCFVSMSLGTDICWCVILCIHISVDFYNLLWVPVGRSVRVVSVMFLCNVSPSV